MSQTISEIAALWARILKQIKEDLNDDKLFEMLLADSYIEEINGQEMIVAVNSGVTVSILSNKYLDLVNNSIRKCSGTVFKLLFVEAGKYNKTEKPIEIKPNFFSNNTIAPGYTFNNFVIGSSNKEAYQASFMMSKPGSLFNPLFIYADSGLGKTHLLHAIGNAFKIDQPGKKVLYVSASDFVEEFVKSVQTAQGDQRFLDYFKTSVDILLLDDVQFLIGKKGTLEMFFNVFQVLYTSGKQIVLTSDQHPIQLDGLPERLKTRFQQGLTVSMTAPDIETSVSILKTKIQALNLDLSMFDDEVLRFYGEKFSSSVRSLESALNRLIFYTINFKPTNKIDLSIGKAAVNDILHLQEDEGKLSEKKIVSVVADYYNLTPTQLTGKIRTAQIALARHIAMYLIRTLLDTPFDKIGTIFSGKDHSTVMNGVSKVEKMLKEDPDLTIAITELKTLLKNN